MDLTDLSQEGDLSISGRLLWTKKWTFGFDKMLEKFLRSVAGSPEGHSFNNWVTRMIRFTIFVDIKAYYCLRFQEPKMIDLNSSAIFAENSVVVKALCYKVAGSRPDEVIFLNLPNPYGRTRPWGLISLWQKWYQKCKHNNVSGSKVRRVRRVEKLTAICEPID
jgi:hypothetical protein